MLKESNFNPVLNSNSTGNIFCRINRRWNKAQGNEICLHDVVNRLIRLIELRAHTGHSSHGVLQNN